jgi:LPXTG-site transpeptidase (sortase) family protein
MTKQPALTKRRKARRTLAFVILAAGLMLVFYVGKQYGEMYAAQEGLVKQWQQQNGANVVTKVGPGSVVRILVPKIRLDAMVVEGTTRKSLLQGPGHLENTPKPGDQGNAVVAGHRDTFFHNLDDLVSGDDVYVLRSGQRYHYVVTRKTVVDPNELSVTDKSDDSRLTLITCYPSHYIGPAPLRLVVLATRTEDSTREH